MLNVVMLRLHNVVMLSVVGTPWALYCRSVSDEDKTFYNVDTRKFLSVCVPVVVFFGPFGSFLSSHFHRQVLVKSL